MSETVLVNEVFGPTIQGEGPSAGRLAAFIRFNACNLFCSWCDTPYTWDWTGRNGKKYDPAEEGHKRSTTEIIQWAELMYHVHMVRLFVITGGEPLLQRDALDDLSARLYVMGPGIEVEVETNGTQLPLDRLTIQRYNVSPKLAHSGIPESVRIKVDVLREFNKVVSTFKFVCERVEDLAEVTSIAEQARLHHRRIWIMPQARTAEELYARTRTLAPAAASRGWNFSSRIQVVAWGAQRGH